MKIDKIDFLDYTIINSGNRDGFVLTKDTGKLYETHLGNYETLDDAKKSAVIYFMIARPEEFATQIARRAMGGSGTYHEFWKFKSYLNSIEMELPEELVPGDGINFMIYYKNQPLTFK